mmetsp:Transcript_5650/g.7969  ORF Transcript_5650/g.7969 Transcript_5650/m.7969 type:complete len:102 (+) Transcript_5650:124-429(+)
MSECNLFLEEILALPALLIKDGKCFCGKLVGQHNRQPVEQELTSEFKKLSLSDQNHQITQKCQYPASTFCTKRIPAGFGYLPILTRFDPSTFIRPPEKTLP